METIILKERHVIVAYELQVVNCIIITILLLFESVGGAI